MGIAHLPESTTRAISSSLVLNDAISVVKELLDNALDAHASNVAIEISANTLDIIQSRDNGGGVGVEDRQLLCKRACTSKIRTLDDLESLGGSSLGFRGEALASIAELSENIAITTRVEGEVVGTLLKYGPAGQMLSSSSASHPIGTTVRVSHFLRTLPVRKQTALKTTSRTLAHVKRLLQSYAFARPSTRFSLKVLKAKNDKANWVYGANSEGNLLQAAASIVGKEVASTCELRHTNCEKADEPVNQGSPMRIDALLCSDAKVQGRSDSGGHFIMIDGRPVNATRGTVQAITKLYKAHFLSSYHRKHSDCPSLNPFLCMHIRCPPKSYDVNVEPAKDEVLFFDPIGLISLATQLFVDYYGPIEGSQRDEVSNNVVTTSVTKKGNEPSTCGFDMLLARAPRNIKSTDAENKEQKSNDTYEVSVSRDENSQPDKHCETNRQTQEESFEDEPATFASPVDRSFQNMYAIDDDHLNGGPGSEDNQSTDCLEQEDAESVVKATNPWSLARMNAPIRTKASDQNRSAAVGMALLDTPRQSVIQNSSPRNSCQNTDSTSVFNGPRLLPTPEVSPRSPSPYQNPGPPLRPWRRREDASEDEVISDPGSSDVVPRQCEAGSLDVWVTHGKDSNNSTPSTETNEQRSTISRLGRSSRSPLRITSVETSSTQSDTNRSQPVDGPAATKPFKSPLKTSFAKVTNLSPTHHGFTPPAFPSPLSPNGSPHTQASSYTELDEIMEWERRKKALAKKHREQFNTSRSGNHSVGPVRPASKDRGLAQLEQTSTFQNSHYTGPVVPEHATPYEDKFGPRSAAMGQVSSPHQQTNNPNHNRYLAALRSLTSESSEKYLSPETSPGDGDGDSAKGSNLSIRPIEADPPQLPDNDPRGYLMRRRKDLGDASSLNENGLMLRRIRTMKLPFESIVKGTELHNLVLEYGGKGSSILTGLATTHTATYAVDGYVKSGNNVHVAWSAFSKEVEVWQARLKTLVGEMYQARVGQDDFVAPNIEICLARAIKNHTRHNENSIVNMTSGD